MAEIKSVSFERTPEIKSEVIPISKREILLLWLDRRMTWILKHAWLHTIIQRFIFVFAWFVSFVFFRVFSRVKIIGRENITKGIGRVIVCNHESLIDSFLIALAMVSLLDVIFHPELIPWNAPDAKNYLNRPFFGQLFRLLKTVPVTREPTKVASIRKMLRDFQAVLRESNLVLFFEGTRSRDGQIGECKSGVAFTVLHAQPVLVPVFLWGMQNIMPICDGNRKKDFSWSNIRLFKNAWIVIGLPIDYQDILSITDEEERYKLIKERIRQQVLGLQNRLPPGVLATPLK